MRRTIIMLEIRCNPDNFRKSRMALIRQLKYCSVPLLENTSRQRQMLFALIMFALFEFP